MSDKIYFPRKIKVKDRRSPDGGYYEAKCDVCGTKYWPKKENAKYCSSTCTTIAYKRRLKLRVKSKAAPRIKAEIKAQKTAQRQVVIPKGEKMTVQQVIEIINSWSGPQKIGERLDNANKHNDFEFYNGHEIVTATFKDGYYYVL